MGLTILDSKSKNGVIKRRIFKCFLNNGRLSIPYLAKELDYSVPTMTKYVLELCDENFLCDYGKIETKEGRYPNAYGVNSEAFYFVGVDIRWFSLTIGLINISGEFVKTTRFEDFVFSNTVETLDAICDYVTGFINDIELDETLNIDRSKILSMNVNIAGRVNPESGYSFSTFNFTETPLADVFLNKIGIETTIDNDTRAMAFGEYNQFYHGKQSDVLFINVGWGVGVGMVIGGDLCFGKSGYSGEFGHMNVFDNDIMCHCGKKGCLETEVSGMALYRGVIDKIKQGSVSVLSEDYNNGRNIDIYDIINAINKLEDMLCIEVLDEVGTKLGRQLANLINLFNPETVVIGGLLANTEDYLLLPVKAAVKKYSLSLINRDTSIVLSKLQDMAGVTGACLMARDRNLEN